MDTISDFLAKIRNSLNAKKPLLKEKYSKIKLAIAKILLDEGYVEEIKKIEEEGTSYLLISLRYTESNEPFIHSIKRLSSPGRHLYASYKDLPKIKPLAGYKQSLGIIIVSTSSGIMTSAEARKRHLGGELIAEIY